jgi:hypothetical protein
VPIFPAVAAERDSGPNATDGAGTGTAAARATDQALSERSTGSSAKPVSRTGHLREHER